MKRIKIIKGNDLLKLEEKVNSYLIVECPDEFIVTEIKSDREYIFMIVMSYHEIEDDSGDRKIYESNKVILDIIAENFDQSNKEMSSKICLEKIQEFIMESSSIRLSEGIARESEKILSLNCEK